jgi:hypothetical protein
VVLSDATPKIEEKERFQVNIYKHDVTFVPYLFDTSLITSKEIENCIFVTRIYGIMNKIITVDNRLSLKIV